MLEAIKTIRKDGSEKFTNGRSETLLDYWAWAHSDIMGNAERGKIAEYIVATALEVHNDVRTEWDSFDLRSKNGIKIEVKSSAYIQTWVQKTYSNIIFGISPTQAWNQENNTYEVIKKRQSNVYVFCVHSHKVQATANPLDSSQWDFYVLNTEVLNEKVPNQKTINLKGIIKLGAKKIDYKGLKSEINRAL